MKHPFTQIMIFAIFVTMLANVSYGLEYMWLTNHEQLPLQDQDHFYSGDTIVGPIRSNEAFVISGSPVFLSRVVTSADDFIHQAGFNPVFLGPQPIFGAPVYPFPSNLNHLRNRASQQGTLFSPPLHHACLVVFTPGQVKIYTYLCGVPFDSTNQQIIPLNNPTDYLYFDCPIRVKGIVAGQVVVASASTIGIDDDLKYPDADMYGRVPPSSTNFLSLACMGDIKINNTVQNGRENSYGLGRSQPNQNRTSIVITGALYAFGGSFTFENQNDPDSGYDYGSTDERGTLNFFGGIVQDRRGYFRRSNHGGTGYLYAIRYDIRLPDWYDHVLNDEDPMVTDTIDFGDVPIGTTALDTARLVEAEYGVLGAVTASFPFHTQRIVPFIGTSFRMPVSISPTQPVEYHGILTVITEYNAYQIVLHARGISPHLQGSDENPLANATLPKSTTLSASPNPFNLSTEIRFTLTEPGPAKIVIYNLQGREVRRIERDDEPAGEHQIQLNASDLASGVYFARLITRTQAATHKLLLIK